MRVTALVLIFLLAGVTLAQQPKDKNQTKPPANTPQPANAKSPTETDKMFAKKAFVGGNAEVQLGQMAQQKGTMQDVKDFGSKMQQDHSKANQELQGIADKEHIALPTELDPPHDAMKARLAALTGSKFDRAYSLEMVQVHEKTIRLFQVEATGGGDPALKNYAAQTLPILKQHLALAKQMNQKVQGQP